MQISRRMFLAATAPGALALAGCGTTLIPTPVTTAIPQWVSAIQAVGTEVGQLVAALPSSVIPAGTVTEIQNVVATIQSIASGISAATTASAGQSALSQIEALINDLAPLILPFTSSIPTIGPIIGIVVAALPAIEALLTPFISLVSSTTQSLATLAPAVTTASGRYRAVFGQNSQAYLQLLLKKASSRYRR